MRLIWSGLAVLVALGWAVMYFYLNALACAFGSAGGDCSIPLPWQMRGEDLQFLVLVPGGVLALLLLMAWRAGRR